MTSLYPDQTHKIKVIHLGVDLSQFRPPTTSQRLQIRRRYHASDSFAIVYAGRFIPIKGIPLLIRAVKKVRKQIPQAKLYLAGGGKPSYLSYLKNLIKKENIPVHLIGYIPRKAMHRVYWLADCFVCPTQGHESFGLVVAESLASGVPTIASRNGGICEIIRSPHNGILVSNYRSSVHFAREIIKIAKNRKLAQKLKKNGRASAMRKFGWGMTSALSLKGMKVTVISRNEGRQRSIVKQGHVTIIRFPSFYTTKQMTRYLTKRNYGIPHIIHWLQRKAQVSYLLHQGKLSY